MHIYIYIHKIEHVQFCARVYLPAENLSLHFSDSLNHFQYHITPRGSFEGAIIDFWWFLPAWVNAKSLVTTSQKWFHHNTCYLVACERHLRLNKEQVPRCPQILHSISALLQHFFSIFLDVQPVQAVQPVIAGLCLECSWWKPKNPQLMGQSAWPCVAAWQRIGKQRPKTVRSRKEGWLGNHPIKSHSFSA